MFCMQFCGGPVLALTCAVDVHADDLSVAVFGWCRDRRSVLVFYERFQGDTEQLDNPDTWGKLRSLIEEREFVADDGKVYTISIALVDSGFRADTVYRFCKDYPVGVYPIKGQDVVYGVREFAEAKTPDGLPLYHVGTHFYKDRWSAALRRNWDGLDVQPAGHFNAPTDATDKQLRELTVEVKRERIQEKTGKRLGFEWHRPSGAKNELWDLLCYNNLGFDLLAWNWCKLKKFESTNWVAFYDLCEAEAMYFRPAAK